MIRPFCSLVLLAGLASVLPGEVWGQIGAPPRSNQPQPAPRNTPPGPSAEDILRFLFPPETQPNNFSDAPRMIPQSPSVAASQSSLRIPSAAEVVQMTAQQQRALLRQGLARLDEELDQLATGASWKTFLQTNALGSALWSRAESEPAPDFDTRQELQAVSQRFAKVGQQPEYGAVRNLLGFQVVQAVLPEYSLGEVAKNQRSLRTSSVALANSLGRLNTAAGWKEHLKTAELSRIANSQAEPEPADLETLQTIAARFDKVSANPEFRQVSSSAGFASSREAVLRLIESHQNEQAAQARRGAGPAPARPNATHMERMIVSLLHDFHALHQLCAEESQANHNVLTLKSAQDSPAAGDKDELAKKALTANEVLRQLKEQHDAAQRAAEEKLRGLLKAFQSGTTKRLGGQPVLLMPLDAPPPKDSQVVELLQFTDEPSQGKTVLLMPLGVDPPKDESATILPLGTDKPKEHKSSEPKSKADP